MVFISMVMMVKTSYHSNLRTETCNTPKPQAFITKLRWDAEIYTIKSYKYYLTTIFPEWLTFHMSVDLNLLSVTPEEFQLDGVEDDIVTKLEKDQIRTNLGKSEIRRC